MKKIVLSLAAVFAFGVASAQTVVEDVTIDGLVSSKGEYYLPQAGDWSIGFNASNAFTYIGNTFNGNASNSGADLLEGSNDLGFVGKMFDTNNTATRYTVNLLFGYGSGTDNTVTDKETKSSSMDLGLIAGYGKEWRKGSTRLQGYYGADALVALAKGSSATETTQTSGGTTTTGKVEASNPFNFAIGARGFVGVEYFVFPKVSLGAQYEYTVVLSYKGEGERTETPAVGASTTTKTSASGFGFELGSSDILKLSSTPQGPQGIGTASVFLNFYF